MSIAEASNTRAGQDAGPRPADVLVVFGITGDLAKVMTFRSLYRLEQRGLLDCPIVGVAVDDWTIDQLRERARESIVATGRDSSTRRSSSASRRGSRTSTATSRTTATYARVAEAIEGATHARSSTSRSRRSCSARSSRAWPAPA